MVLAFFKNAHVVVRGGGDLASGVIYRLQRAGFPVIVLELSLPLFVRRTVCFGEAVYSSEVTIEGVTAIHAKDIHEALEMNKQGIVPVLIDPDGQALSTLNPVVVVDARMEKRNLGTTLQDAPLTIALGPGFTAGEDVHAVVETNRGHDLGRVIWQGSAEPDTGQPGSMKGVTHSRVLRAPTDGFVIAHAEIGDLITKGDTIGQVDGHAILAPFDGVLRGLIHESVPVTEGFKIGDLDPRGDVRACYTISDKSLAVGGGVVEAVLSSDVIRQSLIQHNETTQSI